MQDDVKNEVEARLADHGFRGVFVVNCSEVITLNAPLPATDEALEALEDAFAERAEPAAATIAEEALAS